MRKLAFMLCVAVLGLSGCVGVNQLQPSPMGTDPNHALSPSGKDLTKEHDPPSR